MKIYPLQQGKNISVFLNRCSKGFKHPGGEIGSTRWIQNPVRIG